MLFPCLLFLKQGSVFHSLRCATAVLFIERSTRRPTTCRITALRTRGLTTVLALRVLRALPASARCCLPHPLRFDPRRERATFRPRLVAVLLSGHQITLSCSRSSELRACARSLRVRLRRELSVAR